MGVTEIDNDELASEIGVGSAMAGMIDKFECAADRSSARQQTFDQFRGRRFGCFIGKCRCGEDQARKRKPNAR
jgi:hypothetical protein